MATRTFGMVIMTLVFAVGWAQSDRSVRIAFLPYGDCDTCVRVSLEPCSHDIGVFFTVSPDGQRLYLKDAGDTLHVLSREGRYITSIAVPASPLQGISADGSMVVFDPLHPIRIKLPEPLQPTGVRPLMIFKADGSVDQERTEGFNRALDKMCLELGERYDTAILSNMANDVYFFTGDRLGLVIMSKVVTTESGERSILNPSVLVVLKKDGSWEGPYKVGIPSKRGSVLEDLDPRSLTLEAQREALQRPQLSVEYRILNEDGTEYKRGLDTAYESAPCKVHIRHPEGKTTQEFFIRYDQMVERVGTLLVRDGGRLDASGRLYEAGQSPEIHWRTIPVKGKKHRLTLQDGYQILRFRADGQFDEVVAHLAFPLDAKMSHLWDVDDAGNLYYLHFTSEGIEIRMVPSK